MPSITGGWTLLVPTHKLGKLPPKLPDGLRTLPSYASLPTPPEVVYGPLHIPMGLIGMDGNDTTGDCVVAGADHMLGVWNFLVPSQAVRPTQQEIITEYFKLTGGPDSGLVVSSVLQTWHTSGLWGNVLPAYAPVPLKDPTVLQQAISAYGCVGIGLQLPESADVTFFNPAVWDVVPGSPIIGGHFIVAASYDARAVYCQSWGYTWAVTWDFLDTYADEMWVAIGSEYVANGGGPVLDLAALQADLASI